MSEALSRPMGESLGAFISESVDFCVGFRGLDNQSFCCPGKVLGCELRIRILSILSREICFYYPTGSRADFSNEDRNLERYDLIERLTQRWPPNRTYVLGDNSSH